VGGEGVGGCWGGGGEAPAGGGYLGDRSVWMSVPELLSLEIKRTALSADAWHGTR